VANRNPVDRAHRRRADPRQFTLMFQLMPEGGGPPPHMHERMAEGFHIPEGEIKYKSATRPM